MATCYPPSCYLCAIAISIVEWERYHRLPSWPLVRKGIASLFCDSPCSCFFYVIFFTPPPPSLSSSSPDSSLESWRFRVLGLFVVWRCEDMVVVNALSCKEGISKIQATHYANVGRSISKSDRQYQHHHFVWCSNFVWFPLYHALAWVVAWANQDGLNWKHLCCRFYWSCEVGSGWHLALLQCNRDDIQRQCFCCFQQLDQLSKWSFAIFLGYKSHLPYNAPSMWLGR